MTANSTDKKKKTKRALIRFLIKVGCILAALWIVFSFVITARIQHDNTMFPTISDGELLLIQRFGDRTKDDIILYTANGEEHLGRVIAVGDDTVKIDEGGVLVNGSYRMDTNPYPTPFEDPGVLVVPIGSVYVLADYREEMNDSRLLGCIPEENIIGEVFFTMRYRGL